MLSLKEKLLSQFILHAFMEELPSTARKWPFPKCLNSRLWRLSSALIIGVTATFSKIWLGKLKLRIFWI